MSDELKDLIDSAVPIEVELGLRIDALGERIAEQRAYAEQMLAELRELDLQEDQE